MSGMLRCSSVYDSLLPLWTVAHKVPLTMVFEQNTGVGAVSFSRSSSHSEVEPTSLISCIGE